jgi:hypothetical protein
LGPAVANKQLNWLFWINGHKYCIGGVRRVEMLEVVRDKIRGDVYFTQKGKILNLEEFADEVWTFVSPRARGGADFEETMNEHNARYKIIKDDHLNQDKFYT